MCTFMDIVLQIIFYGLQDTTWKALISDSAVMIFLKQRLPNFDP